MAAEKIAVPAVVRAAKVLDLISASAAPLSPADIARELQLPRSSVHGLCNTLQHLHLITRLESGLLTLGPHVMRWSNAFQARIDITQEFFASWDDMRVLPEETITLSIRDGQEVLYLACRNGSRPLGVTFRTGMRLPVVYTATGKAMLSTLSAQEVRRLIGDEWPKPLTAHGPRNMDTLLEELELVRTRGYSIDQEETREGMHCFGAPVFDANTREAVAGVAVSILSSGLDSTLRDSAGEAIRRLANRLSQRMGATRHI